MKPRFRNSLALRVLLVALPLVLLGVMWHLYTHSQRYAFKALRVALANKDEAAIARFTTPRSRANLREMAGRCGIPKESWQDTWQRWARKSLAGGANLDLPDNMHGIWLGRTGREGPECDIALVQLGWMQREGEWKVVFSYPLLTPVTPPS